MRIGTLIIVLALGIGIGYWGLPSFAERFSGEGLLMMRGGPGSSIDRHFIEEMIPHHEGAIEMAEIALERSKRSEILSLAAAIIEAQTHEIESMRSWYREWFGTQVPEGHSNMMHMGGMEGDTALLASISLDKFDQEFLSQMIPHHEMAIVMSRMLAAGTAREEMRTLAGQIIESQSDEITMMRGWLASW